MRNLIVLALALMPACSSEPTGGGGTTTYDGGSPNRDAGSDAAQGPGPNPTCTLPPYYQDLDGDGFGDMAAAPICGQAPGYVANNLDCHDGDARAFPGQAMFFSTGMLGTNPPIFDFNCDGKEEQQASKALKCFVYNDKTCGNEYPGWVGSVPSCGQSARWATACYGTATSGSSAQCKHDDSGMIAQACR